MTRKKRILGLIGGATVAMGLIVGTPMAAQAASGWAGAYIDGSHCQADRRLYMQEGYTVGPCQNRSGLPGQWFRWSN